MQPVYFVLLAIFALVVISLLAILIRRQTSTADGAAEERLRQSEAATTALREEKSELQRRVAVEEQKSVRLAEVESLLGEQKKLTDVLSNARNTAEKQLATASEALSHIESSLAETRIRLASTEQARDEHLSRLDILKSEKSKIDEMLAVKTEAAARIEIAMGELRVRLLALEQIKEQTLARVETVTSEKSELESVVAQHAATLLGKSEVIDKLSVKCEQVGGELDAARQDASNLRSRIAALQETLEQERKQTEEKLSLLAEAKERMTQEFRILAGDVMKSHGETFSKQNKEQIDTILTPLKEKLGEFQLGLQNAQTESAKERATLAEQIRHLSEHSTKMTMETSNLTRALKGEAQTQGAWGEMILGSILERSGLREGEEYETQQSHETEEGQRLRPDVVVKLPGSQRIVIDSKLSLAAFNEHVNASTDVERALHLKRHLTSIRSHIRTLSSKEYHSAAKSPLDYVVMFIPIEGALAIALQEDPSLTAAAVEANVAIATPTTLMIALRTAANVWQVERRNRNAEIIALRAGKIYDKLVGFIEEMNSLGSRINQAQISYSEAMSKLSSGKGNLVNQVSQLKDLGAKTGKSLPANVLDDHDSGISPLLGIAIASPMGL